MDRVIFNEVQKQLRSVPNYVVDKLLAWRSINMTTKNRKISLGEIEKQYGPLTFGRLLKSHRMGEELTQVEMSKLLKMSKQSLNDLEHGRKIPSIRRAMEIARKIRVMEELVVQLILQDHVRREKLNFTVSVSKGLKAS